MFLSTNQSYVWNVVAQRGRAWWEPMPFALATAAVWGVLTPLIVKWSRVHRIERATWRREVPWHIGLILLIGLIDAGADQLARMATNMPFGYWPDYFRKLDIVTFYYSVIAGVTHAVDYYRRAAQLEAELRQSQLEILKRPLQPHFLFNTLNAVNALIYEDPKSADRVVTRLGELLRMSLAVGNQQEVPLGYELEFVRAYLDIQQIRLGSRLQVSIDVPDDLHDVLVPAMSLQPLVENAVIHGVGRTAEGGRITLRALRDGGDLRLQVCDTGPGFPAAGVREGIGLTNTRERLTQLYGAGRRVSWSQRTPGACVEITVPFRVARKESAA